MPKAIQKRKEIVRTKCPSIRLTEDEHKLISESANNHGLTVSHYLRNLGLNYPIKSITDAKVASDFLKAAGDLGRLGGLFKLWISKQEKRTDARLGNCDADEVSKILDEILDNQKILKELALKIIKDKG